MNRALLAGLSGTLANQSFMDVVGNNVANANTIAYKEQRITFQDAFYQTLQGGRAGTAQGLGGLNPMQIGSGTQIGQVQTIHTQGAMRYSGAPLDAAIEGNGMFVLSDGHNQVFTRDGSFLLDDTLTLVSGSTGLKVMGWSAVNGVVNPTGQPGTLSFPIGSITNGVSTSLAELTGNLDSGLAVGDTQMATVAVYDSLGNLHNVTLTFTKTANLNEWQCTAQIGATTVTTTLTFNGATGALVGGSPLSVSAPVATGAASPLNFDLDLSQMTQVHQAGSNVIVRSQDGRPAATLAGVSIMDGGDVVGEFSNGHVEILGKLAVASFSNVGGLVHIGNNMFQEGAASGQLDIGAAGSGGRGDIRPRRLEMANVDLTRSFVEMMTAQRGFQASTRVISAANRMLDEVMQLNI